jgi:GcrA cell cycle regulator
METIWTAERTEQLKILHAEGLSAAAIAAEMHCFGYCLDHGRNAVIGKMHRLHLPQPVSKQAPKGHSRKTLEGAATESSRMVLLKELKAIAASRLPSDGEAPDGTGIQLIDLTELTCRWPRGNPKTPNFEFCGARPLKGLPYCARHCCLAYQPFST